MSAQIPVQLVAKPAAIAAMIGPIQNLAGWTLSGLLWPGYDPVTKTISDLAADDSPVKWVQTSFFLIGTMLTFVAAVYARAIAMPGRIALAMAGVASLGLTVFATPAQDGYSSAHRVFASIAFVLFSAWPILGIRFDKRYNWSLRPVGAIGATVTMGLTTVWFLLTWLEPERSLVGLSERVIVVMQVVWLSAAVFMQWRHQKR
jgi:hypothetical membrane protein